MRTFKVMMRGKAAPVESHDTPLQAQRAMYIFNAHELKNGRVPSYCTDPPISPEPSMQQLNLPDWAVEALEKHNG